MAGNGPRFTGCGRGVFGLNSWAAQRKPGNLSVMTGPVEAAKQPGAVGAGDQQAVQRPTETAAAVATTAKQSTDVKAPSVAAAGQRLIAKYNYTANASSPLGVNAELSLRQLDKMVMIGPHPQQQFWWMVELDGGQRGYVPANYVMPFEDKVTSLPWLANKPVETVLPPVSNAPYKPYKSAYDKSAPSSSTVKPEYFCDVCQKQLNGPQPYSAHMSSKAHREEVELLKSA